MPDLSSIRRALVGAAVAASICTFVAAPAGAHFTLQEPASWMSQDFIGGPQKLGPCGDEGGGTPTGTVTAFSEGDTITITIDEKIFHPGHYRIALAVNDPSELPAEPVVTPAGTPCGSVEIQSPPVYPVLADGVFVHDKPFSGPQTVQVTLPPNVTCTKCTLQVVEFMSNHPLNNPGGCFYHHCADISIASAAQPDGGGSGGASSGAGGAGSSAGGSGGSPAPAPGCSCSILGAAGGEGGAPALLGLAGVLALGALRRRRRGAFTAGA